jgi:hypothetical protein
MAAKAYEAAMTAQDKYKLGQRELDLLVKEGLIDQRAYTAAMSQLDQEVVKAATSVHKLQEEMQKMLERSTEASSGLKAWALQVQIAAAENGKFTFDILTSATNGAEDNAIKTFFDILEEQRNGQRKLIAELENMWSGYFKNLASMAIKNGMNQLLAPLLKPLTQGGQKTDSQTGATTNAGAGVFAKIFGGGAAKPAGAASGASMLTSAGTALSKAAVELMSAAASLRASGAAGSVSGGASSAASGASSAAGSFAEDTPMFAAGGDATPGSSFISGEAGAEKVDLDRSGGAHITPLGTMAGGATLTSISICGAPSSPTISCGAMKAWPQSAPAKAA